MVQGAASAFVGSHYAGTGFDSGADGRDVDILDSDP